MCILSFASEMSLLNVVTCEISCSMWVTEFSGGVPPVIVLSFLSFAIYDVDHEALWLAFVIKVQFWINCVRFRGSSRIQCHVIVLGPLTEDEIGVHDKVSRLYCRGASSGRRTVFFVAVRVCGVFRECGVYSSCFDSFGWLSYIGVCACLKSGILSATGFPVNRHFSRNPQLLRRKRDCTPVFFFTISAMIFAMFFFDGCLFINLTMCE